MKNKNLILNMNKNIAKISILRNNQNMVQLNCQRKGNNMLKRSQIVRNEVKKHSKNRYKKYK